MTDPADQFYSPYAYVGNRPINYIDPDGSFALPLAAFIAFAADVYYRINNNGQQIPSNININYGPGLSAPQFPVPGLGGIGPFYYDPVLIFDYQPFWWNGLYFAGSYYLGENEEESSWQRFWRQLGRARSVGEWMTQQYDIAQNRGFWAMRDFQMATKPDYELAFRTAQIAVDLAMIPMGGGFITKAGRARQALSVAGTKITSKVGQQITPKYYYSTHALQQISARGLRSSFVPTVIEKGKVFVDAKTGNLVYILPKGSLASGRGISVVTDFESSRRIVSVLDYVPSGTRYVPY